MMAPAAAVWLQKSPLRTGQRGLGMRRRYGHRVGIAVSRISQHGAVERLLITACQP
jgi:hypothetical protein